jgi:hypothetical protein
MLTQKHPYAMQVCPRSIDYNRDAGIFVNLHCIAPAFLFRIREPSSSAFLYFLAFSFLLAIVCWPLDLEIR